MKTVLDRKKAGLALTVAITAGTLIAAPEDAAAAHRIVAMNSVAFDKTQERWPGLKGAMDKDSFGMEDAGNRALIKSSPMRSYFEKVWKALPTPKQISEGVVATAFEDIWPLGIAQISTRLDTGEQAGAYYWLLQRDGRVPYRIGWHMEQHRLPTIGGETSEALYTAMGNQTIDAVHSPWVWLLGVGSEGDGDSVARPCLQDQLPALPGKEDYVKGAIETCPPWLTGQLEESGPTGVGLHNALHAGWRMVGLHGIGGKLIVHFGDRLEEAMAANPDLTLEHVRGQRHGFSHGTMLGKTPEMIETALKYNLYLPVDVYRAFTDETESILEFYGPEGFEFQAPIKSLVDAGVHVMSDRSTWEDVGTMVHRRHPASEEVMEPEERVDRVTSFKLATIVPAEFNFSEDISGSIEVGKVADFQVVEEDFLDSEALPDEEIDHVTVLMTIVDDDVVWTSEEAPEEFKALPHFYGREYLGPDTVPGRSAM